MTTESPDSKPEFEAQTTRNLHVDASKNREFVNHADIRALQAEIVSLKSRKRKRSR